MRISNHERIGKGLQILRGGLLPYALRELKSAYKERWWESGVKPVLSNTAGRDAWTDSGSPEERFAGLDIQALLAVMWENWNDVFENDLGHIGRGYVSEVRKAGSAWAQQQPFSPEDAFRALDTMTRLLEIMHGPGVEELRALSRTMMFQQVEAESKRELQKSAAAVSNGTAQGLRPWREVITPHPDVASGRYKMAEFAADLFQVTAGRAEAEYGDAAEFFRRTYLTEGLIRLLSRAWARLTSTGGDPVVELQTNFGGGKTHSMLALYHLFGGQIQPQDVPGLENLIPPQLKNGSVHLPAARRAALVGTQISPAEVRTKPDGIQVRTLWGEMAWQIGHAAGQAARAYGLVAEEDRRGVSPGSEKLAKLFEEFGPVLVLIDEWVAYARQLYSKDDLPGGSFDANMTFAQALTEAAKAVPNALVVAAIPQSDIEIGGEGGKAALERIRNVFGRLEAVWKPATAAESFEIVRRRLFQPVADYAMRNAVCRAFAEMYRENRAEFPAECREMDYEKRLISAYPIHPELFDRLYEDWSTLERFQRTRGVLRMMAAIVHELWEHPDGSLLIMPGSVPMNAADVRFEVTRYLPEGWGAVVDKDIDGIYSRPLAIDRDNPNLGRFTACRRVARTVFIGSAPSAGQKRTHGIEEVRVKLGCVQPGEAPAVFGDALRRLSEELTYLYSDATRYWFDTRPTITRIAADRAAQYEQKPEFVEDEIIRRVKELARRERGDFAGVHAIPGSSGDVPDETSCRLVILAPSYTHRYGSSESKALEAAREILEQRGSSPRLYRNMLVFLAADAERLTELQQAVRHWLSWTSIKQDEEQLNLDVYQKRQAEKQIQTYEDTINARLLETYCWLIVPTAQGAGPTEWSFSRLQGSESLAVRAAKKLKNEQQLITQWSPALLRMELDRWLWKDANHISVKKLWEYMAQYLYLSRLRDEEVLIAAIRSGAGSVNWSEYFACASAVKEDGSYLGLVTGSTPLVTLDQASVLVKPEAAKKQREEETKTSQAAPPYSAGGQRSANGVNEPGLGVTVSFPGERLETQKEVVLRRFHGTVELDAARLGRDAGRISDEVLIHLISLAGAKAAIVLEIDVEVPDGIPEDKVRIITENCNTLKFKTHDFEE